MLLLTCRKCSRFLSQLDIVTSTWKSNPVRQFGESHNLPVHSWPISTSSVDKFDIGVVSSFGHLLPQDIINAFPLGILNIHGSILPRWRGAAPVIYAIMHGDSDGGITIMRVHPFKFDVGEIVRTRKTHISPTESAAHYRMRLAVIGADELIAVLHKLPHILEEAYAQPQDGVTYAPKVTSALGMIDFNVLDARSVFNRYRALSDFISLTTYWLGSPIRLHHISLDDANMSCVPKTIIQPSLNRNLDKNINAHHGCILYKKGDHKGRPGQVRFDKLSKQLSVQCMDGNHVKVGGIALPRKRVLSSLEFYNGYLSKHPEEKWYFGS